VLPLPTRIRGRCYWPEVWNRGPTNDPPCKAARP
jgi:hypothetical protein